jgi:indole-3-glycerol phosphate synthase
MTPKEQQNASILNGEVPMEFGKMTPDMERCVIESLQVGDDSTMAHIFGHKDPDHTLSMLQRVALKQVVDYHDKMQNYDQLAVELRQQMQATEERLGPRLNLLEVIQGQKPAVALAAEFKRASPSKGDIAVHLNAGEQATKYYDAGACIISCLTEEHWFKGTLADLTEIREMTQEASKNYPDRQRPAILRKEFIVNTLQILEAAAAGADTILLIVAITPSDTLKTFIDFCRSVQLEPLVEVHAPDELDVALQAGAKVIGVNNRNLHTFQLDLATTDRTAAELTKRGLHFDHNNAANSSSDYAVCSLSGMSHAEDVERYRHLGVGMVLIGEALMRSPDPKAAISSLCLHPDAYQASHQHAIGAAYTGGTKVVKGKKHSLSLYSRGNISASSFCVFPHTNFCPPRTILSVRNNKCRRCHCRMSCRSIVNWCDLCGEVETLRDARTSKGYCSSRA